MSVIFLTTLQGIHFDPAGTGAVELSPLEPFLQLCNCSVLLNFTFFDSALKQLVEHSTCTDGIDGSKDLYFLFMSNSIKGLEVFQMLICSSILIGKMEVITTVLCPLEQILIELYRTYFRYIALLVIRTESIVSVAILINQYH